MLLGSRIRQLRVGAGLTQAQLGAPRTRSFVSAVEHGRTLPSLRALLQMADRLGVPVAVLLDDLEWPAQVTYTLPRDSDSPPPSDCR